MSHLIWKCFLGKVFNIDYGNIDFDKFKFENSNIEFNFELDNIDSKNGVKQGGRCVGVTADDDRGCYDLFDPVWPPVWPRFTVNVIQFEVKFEVTVAFFRSNKPQNFSMFPYSI